MKHVMVAMLFMLSVALLGCEDLKQHLAELKEKTQEVVVTLDEKAQENRTIVEKLCIDPASVPDEERVVAIRNARLIAMLTLKLREAWVPDYISREVDYPLLEPGFAATQEVKYGNIGTGPAQVRRPNCLGLDRGLLQIPRGPGQEEAR